MALWVLSLPYAEAFRPRYEVDANIDVGAQYGTIDQWRLGIDASNNTTNTPNQVSGFFKTARLRVDNRLMYDISENMVLDVRSLWNIAYYDPQNINSERYDVFYGDHRAQFGYAKSDKTLFAANLYLKNDKEDLFPQLDALTLGGDVALDRTLGEHVFLTFRTGGSKTDLQGGDNEWDHSDVFFRALYTNAAPERYSIDALPAHPERYSPDTTQFFEMSKMLELWRSRRPIRRDGKNRRILEQIPPGPAPPTQDLKVDVEIMESIFAGGFGVTNRTYDNLTNQSFLEADADAYVRWSLGRNLALTFQDRFAWQDYEQEDNQRLLFDHWENDFNLSLSHSRVRQHLRLDASLRSVVFDIADEWTYHTSRLAGSWDYRDSKRYSYSVRSSYQREMPISEREGNQYTKEFRFFGAFRIHFNKEKFLRFSWEREREIVTGIQSEFDSSYNTDTLEMRYRHHLNQNLAWEAGYSFERERHEIFYGNNRDEEFGFLNLSVHL